MISIRNSCFLSLEFCNFSILTLNFELTVNIFNSYRQYFNRTKIKYFDLFCISFSHRTRQKQGYGATNKMKVIVFATWCSIEIWEMIEKNWNSNATQHLTFLFYSLFKDTLSQIHHSWLSSLKWNPIFHICSNPLMCSSLTLMHFSFLFLFYWHEIYRNCQINFDKISRIDFIYYSRCILCFIKIMKFCFKSYLKSRNHIVLSFIWSSNI